MNQEKWLNAIRSRHSVRTYLSRAIDTAALSDLSAAVRTYNQESGLRIQLFVNEPRAFTGLLAHYGRIRNVTNYIALVAPEGPEGQEKAGYYGELLVLQAQALGLNTCWVALTYSKGKCPVIIKEGEKLVCVIALGYGVGPGKDHRSKPLNKLCAPGDHPDWFLRGMEAALLAPTAVNQQRFYFSREGAVVTAKDLGGPCGKIDLGIVKCHFALAAGTENFTWSDQVQPPAAEEKEE